MGVVALPNHLPGDRILSDLLIGAQSNAWSGKGLNTYLQKACKQGENKHRMEVRKQD